MARSNKQVEAETATQESEVEVPELKDLGKGHTRFEEQSKDEVVSPIVLAELLGVRPQMVYNYIRSGRIDAVQHNNTQKLVIPLDEAQKFADSYLRRKALKAIKVKEELAGTSK